MTYRTLAVVDKYEDEPLPKISLSKRISNKIDNYTDWRKEAFLDHKFLISLLTGTLLITSIGAVGGSLFLIGWSIKLLLSFFLSDATSVGIAIFLLVGIPMIAGFGYMINET